VAGGAVFFFSFFFSASAFFFSASAFFFSSSSFFFSASAFFFSGSAASPAGFFAFFFAGASVPPVPLAACAGAAGTPRGWSPSPHALNSSGVMSFEPSVASSAARFGLAFLVKDIGGVLSYIHLKLLNFIILNSLFAAIYIRAYTKPLNCCATTSMALADTTTSFNACMIQV
jgi:hypothetical protein